MKSLADRLGNTASKGLWWGTLLIIVALPFHVLAYSLLLAHLHPLAGPFKDWKEALTCLMVAVAGGLLILRPKVARRFVRLPEAWLIGAFTLLNCLFAIWTPDRYADLLAIKINIIFLLLFLAAWVSTAVSPKLFRDGWLVWCLLIPAAAVGIFGLAQLWLLPVNFLTHLGYGMGVGQIHAYELLSSSTIIRVQSILFGPNQFGSYLVLPLVVSLWVAWHNRSWAIRGTAAGLFILLLINLYATQSRGSWLGGLAAIATLVWLSVNRNGRIILGAIGVALVTATIILAPAVSHSHFAPEILHQSGQDVESVGGSTGQHLSRLQTSLNELRAHPWGQNLTVVGRPSDLIGSSFYSENFYLQIADQLGIEGLIVFLAIVAVVAFRLYQSLKIQPLAGPFLAALIGISVMNLFAQTWTDGATALLWWGGAGLILGASSAQKVA